MMKLCIIYSSTINNYNNIFDITKLFLENGMEIKNDILEAKYGKEVINPIWTLAFKCDDEGIRTVKLLLDNNLEIDSAEILVDHIYTDYIFLEYNFETAINNKNYFNNFEYALKTIMLCASYPYILQNSDFIHNIVEFNNNNYDINKFKKYNDYYIKLDNKNKGNNITINFIYKKTNKVVWQLNFLITPL